VDVAEI